MEIQTPAKFRAVEEKVARGRTGAPPPSPVHHKATAHASQHPLPHGPGIRPVKRVVKKKLKAPDVSDKLLGYIKHANEMYGDGR
jgi:hypothetical protein